MDAIDRRMLGLRAKLSPDPYADPAFMEDYVTYLSPHKTQTVPRGLAVADAFRSDSARGRMLTATSLSDIDEYYPVSGADMDPPVLPTKLVIRPGADVRPTDGPDTRRASTGSAPASRDRHHRARDESKDHRRTSDHDRHYRHDGEKDHKLSFSSSSHREHDRRSSHSPRDHELTTRRDSTSGSRHEHRDSSHSKHDSHTSQDKLDDNGQSRSTPKNSKVTSDKPKSSKDADKQRVTTKSDKASSNHTITLPPMLSPTLPPYFDSILFDDSAEKKFEMPQLLSPTLPSIYDSDSDNSSSLAGLGIRMNGSTDKKPEFSIKGAASSNSETVVNLPVEKTKKEIKNDSKDVKTEPKEYRKELVKDANKEPVKDIKKESVKKIEITKEPKREPPKEPANFKESAKLEESTRLKDSIINPKESTKLKDFSTMQPSKSKESTRLESAKLRQPVRDMKKGLEELKENRKDALKASTSTKSVSRIVVLRVPSFKNKRSSLPPTSAAQSKRRKVEEEPEVPLRAAAKPASSVQKRQSPKPASTNTSTPVIGSSKLSAVSTSSTPTLTPTIASTSFVSKQPSNKSPQPSTAAAKIATTSEKHAEKSVSPNMPEQVMTPPPTTNLGDMSVTPGTPGTKKSTLAEYKQRKRNFVADSFSFAAPELEKTNSAPGASNVRVAAVPVQRTNSTSAVSSSTSNPDADRGAQLLENKAKWWLSLATDRKHQSDRHKESGDIRMASLYAMDALLAYLVGFDYEDKCAVIQGRIPSEKGWMTLVPYGSHLVNLHQGSKSPVLVGLSYYIRAVVYLRMAGFQQQCIKQLRSGEQSVAAAESPETTTSSSASGQSNDLLELFKTMSKNIDLAAYDLQRGSRLLPIDMVISNFPETWRRRTAATEYLSGTAPAVFGGSTNGPGLRPLVDKYVLPIQTYSGVREVAAFGAVLLSEWAEQNHFRYESVLVKGVERA
ncbi:hypothetical protein V1512DRAFT_251949 [Lipomyces arxii]|uniref:uncharacterized protein n=1 Tax=Lipomyces arxii TaxID=56418 RepID=UPI0034CE22E7